MIDSVTRGKVFEILVHFHHAPLSTDAVRVAFCALARAFGHEPSDSQPIPIDHPAIADLSRPTRVTLVDAMDEECSR